jgi:hypothetical protein
LEESLLYLLYLTRIERIFVSLATIWQGLEESLLYLPLFGEDWKKLAGTQPT